MYLENQQQSADQASTSNSIGSLRFLGVMDWSEFVESTSLVEKVLGEDPVKVYGIMDFATRDRYRHVVEQTARRSPFSEVEVADRAIGLAREGAALNGEESLTAHVGYYLIDNGLGQLNTSAKVRNSTVEFQSSPGSRLPLLLYGGGILFLSVLFAGGLAVRAQDRWLARVWTGSDEPALACLHQPLGGGPGKLGGNPADRAARPAASGFLQGYSKRPAYPGRHPDHACQRPGHRRSGQGPGSPFFGQQGPNTCISVC